MLKAIVNLIKGYKREKLGSMNTYDILKPINILSYITGCRIFEYPRENLWPKSSFLYGMLLYSVYVVGWYYQRALIRQNNIFNLQGAMFQITGFFNEIATFVVIIVGCHQSKSLKLSVKRIHEIDVTLRALGSPGSFNTIYKKTIVLLTLGFSQLIVYLGLHILVLVAFFSVAHKTTVIFFSTVTQFYGQMVEYVLIIEFLIIVSCIGSEFQRANDLLSDINVLPSSSIAMELLDYNNSKDPFSTNKSFFDASAKLFTLLPYSRRLRSHLQATSHEIVRSRRLLQTIRQVHLELYKTSKRISMIYGVQTSMEMSLCILYATYATYSVYYTYNYESYVGVSFIVIVFGTLLICVNNFLKNFSVNYVCEKTTKQAQRTNEIIYTFYGQSTDSELQKEMEMFSLQMMHCQVMFSASGLYAFSCKNICGSIGMITTYVVIMIQVTNSMTNENL